MNEEKFMLLAIKEAKRAYNRNEVPIGAIIVKNNKCDDISQSVFYVFDCFLNPATAVGISCKASLLLHSFQNCTVAL